MRARRYLLQAAAQGHELRVTHLGVHRLRAAATGHQRQLPLGVLLHRGLQLGGARVRQHHHHVRARRPSLGHRAGQRLLGAHHLQAFGAPGHRRRHRLGRGQAHHAHLEALAIEDLERRQLHVLGHRRVLHLQVGGEERELACLRVAKELLPPEVQLVVAQRRGGVAHARHHRRRSTRPRRRRREPGHSSGRPCRAPAWRPPRTQAAWPSAFTGPAQCFSSATQRPRASAAPPLAGSPSPLGLAAGRPRRR